jgi:hypothetical protein
LPLKSRITRRQQLWPHLNQQVIAAHLEDGLIVKTEQRGGQQGMKRFAVTDEISGLFSNRIPWCSIVWMWSWEGRVRLTALSYKHIEALPLDFTGQIIIVGWMRSDGGGDQDVLSRAESGRNEEGGSWSALMGYGGGDGCTARNTVIDAS